ncbi:MAG: hypothetical protein ABIR59_10135 [Gemmatimonadales bacterium]
MTPGFDLLTAGPFGSHASLGDVDEAFEWLEAAITEKASGLMWLRCIRGSIRFGPTRVIGHWSNVWGLPMRGREND